MLSFIATNELTKTNNDVPILNIMVVLSGKSIAVFR